MHPLNYQKLHSYHKLSLPEPGSEFKAARGLFIREMGANTKGCCGCGERSLSCIFLAELIWWHLNSW